MSSIHGPHPVSGQGQVKIPTALMRALRLQPGDQYYWRRSDDDPDVLLLVPAEVVERRYQDGAAREAGGRPTAESLPTTDVDGVTAGPASGPSPLGRPGP